MKKGVYLFMILVIAFSFVSCNDKKEQVGVFEYEKELTNLIEITKGEDILRYPENYDGKQLDFYGYVLGCTENTVFVTASEIPKGTIETLKENSYGAFFRAVIKKEYYMGLEIPYTNDKSPRLLIGDTITFTGTVHAKLVDVEVIRTIDNITNMKIVATPE